MVLYGIWKIEKTTSLKAKAQVMITDNFVQFFLLE
jgi:hypothetical protein